MTSTSKAIAVSALIILLCIGVLSYRSTVRDEEDRGWVAHTHLAIEKLQAILFDLTQAETGQRGYILTGQEKYLVPYKTGVDQLGQDTNEFRNLTADNPRQQEAIQRLQPLVVARLAGLEQRMSIRRTGGLIDGAKAVAEGNNGEALMEEIRSAIGEMRQEEEQLLIKRLGAAAASAQRTKTVIVLGNGFAFLILLAAGFLTQRETVRRSLAEQRLKRVNEELEQRTIALSDANHEMESFSYSVAHDLRAPLRQIAGYSNVLIQDHGSRLDAEAQRYLEKVESGARKMGRLVDDLLSLSKIGRQELSLQTISLGSVVNQVREELASECSGRQIDWQVEDLFTVECDPGLMKQAFINLLSNAVKYTGKKDHALIEVGQLKQNGARVIYVRDNGAGFEMQYVGKLFGVFQRLHKSRDFEGTGVGLAIVQRIVRKHGGRIWAEAKLNEGATFFFTLGFSGNNHNNEPEPEIKNEDTHVTRG
jgi:signal transduction histidine kinase